MSDAANGRNFRTALHGFNREDVVNYIESTALEAEKEKRLLRDANARLQAELDEANAAAEQAKQLPALQQDLEQAQAKIDELSQQNRTLEAETARLQAELEKPGQAASQERQTPLNAPIPSVSDVMPVQPTVSSSSYSELELAAYRRAEVTERLARERAGKIYEQVNSVFSGASARLEENEHDLDQLSKTLQMNVDQLQQILYAIRCTYTEAGESFKAVGEKNHEYAASEV